LAEAHQWGEASRNWKTYSFVPNLVWLPSQLSKLSDREGSFVQTLLQAIARKIYRSQPQSLALEAMSDEVWALLPERVEGVPVVLPDAQELNYFALDEAWISRRIQTLATVETAVGQAAAGTSPTHKIVSSRYGTGLGQLTRPIASKLSRELKAYRGCCLR
jgi:hypothetical protein